MFLIVLIIRFDKFIKLFGSEIKDVKKWSEKDIETGTEIRYIETNRQALILITVTGSNTDNETYTETEASTGG